MTQGASSRCRAKAAVGAGIALVAIVASKSAAAATSRFELAWKSAAGERACITEEELKSAVSTKLGRDPFVPAGKGEIAIAGEELPARLGRLRARIVQRDAEGHVLGTRDLDGSSCEDLRRSATFVVFLIVDPEAAFGGSPKERPAEKPNDSARGPGSEHDAPTSGTPAAREDRGASALEAAERRRAAPASARASAASGWRVRADLGFALLLSNGLLPKTDVGPALTLGVRPLPLPLRLEWRASYRLAVQGALGYDFRAVEQSWRVCTFLRVAGPVFGTACGGATWAAILPETHGLARGDQAPKSVFGPTLVLGPAVELGETRVFADLSLSMLRPRYAFTFRDEGRTTTLYELSRVTWSLGIGVTRSF